MLSAYFTISCTYSQTFDFPGISDSISEIYGVIAKDLSAVDTTVATIKEVEEPVAQPMPIEKETESESHCGVDYGDGCDKAVWADKLTVRPREDTDEVSIVSDKPDTNPVENVGGISTGYTPSDVEITGSN